MDTKIDESNQTRQELLNEQQNLVGQILEKLGSVEAAAVYIGVSTDSINNWLKDEDDAVIAKGLTRQKLLDAAQRLKTGDIKPPVALKRGGGGDRYDIEPDKRAQLETKLIELRLMPPEVRAATLRELLEKSKLTIAALAREIEIHENTLKDYLNPEYTRLMTLATAQRIQALQEKLEEKLEEESDSPRKRLEKALSTLLSEEIVRKGFEKRDWRRMQAAEIIAPKVGLSARNVRRYLPPLELTKRRLPLRVVEAFENAAESGSILSKIKKPK